MRESSQNPIGRRAFLRGSAGCVIAASSSKLAPLLGQSPPTGWKRNRKVLFICVDCKREAAEAFNLYADRIGDIFLLGEKHVAFGDLEKIREDVAIRSHGSRHEATVPIICYGRKVDAGLYRRNLDLTRNFEWDA